MQARRVNVEGRRERERGKGGACSLSLSFEPLHAPLPLSKYATTQQLRLLILALLFRNRFFFGDEILWTSCPLWLGLEIFGRNVCNFEMMRSRGFFFLRISLTLYLGKLFSIIRISFLDTFGMILIRDKARQRKDISKCYKYREIEKDEHRFNEPSPLLLLPSSPRFFIWSYQRDTCEAWRDCNLGGTPICLMHLSGQIYRRIVKNSGESIALVERFEIWSRLVINCHVLFDGCW